jgi:hypothetical protein
MAELSIDGGELVVGLGPWERLGAVRGDLRVPLSAIAEVREVAAALRHVRGSRAPGTAWPGKIALGIWRGRYGKDFVAAYKGEPGVIIELHGHAFSRVVVSGQIPDAVLALG